MEERIFYCKKCHKTFSGSDDTSQACSCCGSATFDTGVLTAEWREKSAEEKEQLKKKFRNDSIMEIPVPKSESNRIIQWLKDSFASMIAILFVATVVINSVIGFAIGQGIGDGYGLIGLLIGLMASLIAGVSVFGLAATIISIADTQNTIVSNQTQIIELLTNKRE